MTSGDIENIKTDNEEPNEGHVAQVPFSWFSAVLLVFFGFSSWIAINSLWVELPLLVNVLPEGWNLPAYLSILIQIANIGPLAYVLFTRLCNAFGHSKSDNIFKRLVQPPERLANYCILIIGVIASLLLMKYWDAVVMMTGLPANAVYGQPITPEALYNHSLGLFLLTFLLGMIDCMSSVTFLAYLANTPAVYAGALLFGETASGLLPSLYALGQGVNSASTCVNGTAIYSEPRFGVSIFMGLVAGTTLLSFLAFLLLDCLPSGLGRPVTLAYRHHHSVPTSNEQADQQQATNQSSNSNALCWVCFVLMGYASCLTNGLLPSLQSFSTAAYSSTTFHLAVTLSGITAPIVALVTTAVYGYDQLGLCVRSIIKCFCGSTSDSTSGNNEKQSAMASIVGGRLAVALTAIGVTGSVFACYAIYLAKASPNPPEIYGGGPAIAVLTWIMLAVTFGVQKTWITLHMVKYGSQRNLRNLGIATQIGAFMGSLISFLLTATFNLFTSKNPCS
nr:riboflavin transporter 2 A [Hymenolepis microstoma]